MTPLCNGWTIPLMSFRIVYPDPESEWSCILLGANWIQFGVQVRIQILIPNAEPDPDPGRQKGPLTKKIKNFMLLKIGCSLWHEE
jgi:hypothetical protein